MKLFWGIALSFWGIQAYAVSDWQAQIMADAERIYTPAAHNLALDFSILNDPKSLAASADSDGVTAKVVVDAGMLASPRLTPDSLRITVCHELGHIYGGSPRRNVPLDWEGPIAEDGRSHLSAEGEADYYTTLVCFRKMVDGQDHQAALAGRTVPLVTKSKCATVWGADTNEALICERAALGSLDFLNFIKDFDISLERKAPEVALRIILDQYPSRQCRLDTFVAGALCRKEFSLQLDRNNSSASDCPQPEAKRPACWYPQPEAIHTS